MKMNTSGRREEAKGEKSKYRLAEALRECMRTESIREITVRQITARCQVSRQTFYRNFRDKYDLMNWYFDKLLERSFDRMGSGRTIREGLIRKFDYIREEQVFFRGGFRSQEQNNLREHDFEMICIFYRDLIKSKTGTEPSEEVSELIEMYCQAQIHMTVKWVLGGMEKSSEQLAELMLKAMPGQLRELFGQISLLD